MNCSRVEYCTFFHPKPDRNFFSVAEFELGMHRTRAQTEILGLGNSRAPLFSGSVILRLDHPRPQSFILGLGHSFWGSLTLGLGDSLSGSVIHSRLGVSFSGSVILRLGDSFSSSVILGLNHSRARSF